MSTDIKYKLTDTQVSTSLSGESVILNHGKGSYYSLNEVGTFVWDIFQKGPQTKAFLKQEVMASFEVSRKDCENDLRRLIDSLINEGLIEEA
ncbi:MAG: hypothetical protein ACI8UX_001983 [Psychromonas sp.]|jgi:hypothetical protein